MARRGENIRKRKDGRWEARYHKGRKADGSIQYGYVYAKKYKDVKLKRDQILKSMDLEAEALSDSAESKILLNDLFELWKTDIRHNIKDSSFCYYETIINHHLSPYFGQMKLQQINPNVAQAFIQTKLNDNLSPLYIRSIIALFKNILKFAQEKYQWKIQIPVFQLPKTIKKKPEIFTVQEWKSLEQYLKQQNDEFSFGILICMYTGLRIGELSGLKWEDYDSGSVLLKVRRTVYRIKNTAYSLDQHLSKTILCISSPKTSTSIRDIPLPLSLMDSIQKHRRSPDTYILTGTKNFMEPRNIQKKYKKLLMQSGLRYLNFHSLRHNFATFSIQSGSDCTTVAELLGHCSVNTTLNTYVHSDINQKRKCLELLLNKW